MEKRLDAIAALGHDIPAASGKEPPVAVTPFNEKTAQIHQARWASSLRLSVVQTNSIGMKLVLIPPGEFLMGSLPGEGDSNECPRRCVRITPPLLPGRVPGDAGRIRANHGEDLNLFQIVWPRRAPVDCVDWEEAAAFCRRLSNLPEERAAGRTYQLPTEAQWEYACRAGSTTRYSFGDSEAELGEYAWFSGNSDRRTHPVGQKKPNAWRLYDMHGHLFEWCAGLVRGRLLPAICHKRPNRPALWPRPRVAWWQLGRRCQPVPGRRAASVIQG